MKPHLLLLQLLLVAMIICVTGYPHDVPLDDYDDNIERLQHEIESMFVVDATYPHFIQQPLPPAAASTESSSPLSSITSQLRQHASQMWDTRTVSSGVAFRQILAYDPYHISSARALAVALLSQGDAAEAFAVWQTSFRHRHALPLPGATMEQMIASIPIRNGTNSRVGVIVPHRLRHDIEQFRYLLQRSRLPSTILTPIIQRYEDALRQLTNSDPAPSSSDALLAPAEIWSLVAETYNRALYVPHLARVTGSTLSQRTITNAARITAAYYASTPHILAVDELLSASTLHRLLTWAQEATVWYESYPTYLGVSLSMGLASDLILQLAHDLRSTLPHIFCDLHLVQSWAFKYDDQLLQAINIHADDAAVNFNLWLTPNDANMDPSSGGLIVYHAKPTRDWNFMQFNGRDRHHAAAAPSDADDAHHNNNNDNDDPIASFLDLPAHRDSSGNRRNSSHRYQQNRAVLFESSLFHASDTIRFKRGYTNRRINLTLLFGRQGQTCRHHFDAHIQATAAAARRSSIPSRSDEL